MLVKLEIAADVQLCSFAVEIEKIKANEHLNGYFEVALCK